MGWVGTTCDMQLTSEASEELSLGAAAAFETLGAAKIPLSKISGAHKGLKYLTKVAAYQRLER